MDALEKLTVREPEAQESDIFLKIPDLNMNRFKELCQANQNLRLERASTGEVMIMPPTYPWTGRKNFSLIGQIWQPFQCEQMNYSLMPESRF